MNSFDWKFLSILSGGLGVFSILLGNWIYSYQPCGIDLRGCDASGLVGLWFMSLGFSGGLFALLSLDSALRKGVILEETKGVPPARTNGSTLSLVIIGLFAISMTATVYLTPAMLSAPPSCDSFCNTQQINITGASINVSDRSVAFSLSNSGTSDVVLDSASVTGGSYTSAPGTMATVTASSIICSVSSGLATIPKGTSCILTATFTSGGSFVAGTTYSFKLVSTKGSSFPYSTTA